MARRALRRAGAAKRLEIRKRIAMTANKLRELLRQRPFRPLRLYLADGRIREIVRPQMALIAESELVIGVPRDDKSNIAKELKYCSIGNIVKVEPFDIDGNSANEKKPPKKGRGR